MIRRIPWVRLIKFGFTGVLNTAFGYTIFAAGVWAGLDSGIALLIATCIGVVFNFFTTGRLVFENRDRRLIYRFVSAYGIIYVFNVVLLKMLQAAGLTAFAAQAICLIPVVLLSFVILQVFVFARKTPAV